VEELIKQQNELLSQLIELLGNKQELGFGVSPRPQYVYCNRSNTGMLWYTLDEARNPIAIPHAALTGYITQLEFKQVERRGKETWKTHLHITADRLYILESGFDSHFSKGLVSALASLESSALKQPITIEVQPAESEEVLFCRVYSDGKLIYAPYDEQTDWTKLSDIAQSKVNGTPIEPQRHYTESDTWIRFQKAIGDAIRNQDEGKVSKMVELAFARIDDGTLPEAARSAVKSEWERAIEAITSVGAA
jgi:hypothetical protein